MPVNQALSVFQSQFYQRFTNISGEPDLRSIIPEFGDGSSREPPLTMELPQVQSLAIIVYQKIIKTICWNYLRRR